MSKYFYRIFTIIDLHFGAMQPCSSGLGMTLYRSVRFFDPSEDWSLTLVITVLTGQGFNFQSSVGLAFTGIIR